MSAFKNVSSLKTEKTTNKTKTVMKSKSLWKLSNLFCILLSFSLLGVSFSFFGFSEEMKQITSSWSPNLQDIGKLKFVSGDETETEKEVSMLVSQMGMPFNNYYVTAGSESFVVSGLGSLIVKSCLNGKVKKIESTGLLKTITISHGKGLATVYENLDLVGVKEGDLVNKNTPIGISNNSEIGFKILLKGKVLAGLTVKDGEMFFA